MTPSDYDDDIPFHLPKSDHEEDDIYKADTEDIIIPEGGWDGGVTDKKESTEDIRYLHSTDEPEPDETIQRLVDHENANDDDDDVPFHLPQNDDSGDDSPIGTKFVTMPSPPRRSAPTLAGSGGLDPNPDFIRKPTPTLKSPQRAVPPPQPQMQPRQHVPIPPQGPESRNKQLLPPKRRRKRFNVGCIALFLGLVLTFCGGITLITFVGGVYAYARVGDLLNERITEFDAYQSFQSTLLYDRNGRELYEIFGEGRRTNVSLDKIPQYLINATISIEDDTFYNNIGIDVPATTIALLRFVGAEADEQTAGGSTITQQLVRNVLFDPEYRSERTPQRKAEEIFLALALTSRKSKDTILELYLNEIYYGNLAYGVQAASHVFFGKDVGELTLGEAALLAGLPQAPANLDPLNPDPEIQTAVYTRWRQVLNEMVEEGYITDAQRNQTLSTGLSFSSPDVPLNAPHFTVYAKNQLEALMLDLGYSPENIARGGLHVYTTVDLRINERAQEIARNQVVSLSANNISNAAVVVIKPATGEIMAMVGSIDYNNEAIDGHVNVTTAVRQPGSTMKPFTYAAALERGMTAGDVIWDTRTSIGIAGQDTYVPRNYDGGFHGPVTIRTALANSYNIPAVQTLRHNVGVDYLLNLMQRFGVVSLGNDASRYGLSLTLGGGEISPLELTRAFSVFANEGVLVNTTAILCILDNDDNIIYQYENGCPKGNPTPKTVARTALGSQVLDPRIAFIISDILADNNARSTAMGSNSPLYTPNIATSVKTGTTNDVKDNWTVGYTRNVAVGVWVGNNNGDPMYNTSGLTGAAPIWNAVVSSIYTDPVLINELAIDGQLISDQISAPNGMSRQQICDVRRLNDPAPTCPSTITEWFLDSPAGLPNGQGGFDYPPAENQPPPQVPSNGSFVQKYSPGVFRTVVYPLSPTIADAIQFNVTPGQRPPPAPLYCRMPVELIASTQGIAEQLFIAPPSIPADAAEAEEYARSRGLAFLPTIDCTLDLIQASVQTVESFPPVFLQVEITSPQPNQVITDAVPIMGTINFTPDQASFYVFQIIGGQFSEWTAIQEAHYNGVINGQLETLPGPPGLQPGNYQLRLVIVGHDSNIIQQPYIVPFIVQ